MIKCFCYNIFCIYLIVLFLNNNNNRIFVSASRDLACSINLCSDLGEPCSYNPSENTGLECYVEDFCYNNTCIQGVVEYGECTTSRDCEIGFSCVPADYNPSIHVCEKAFYVEFGGFCNKSLECVNSLECINNVCSTPSYGCISDNQCDLNSICVNGQCEHYDLKDGECFVQRSFSCKSGFTSCALNSFNISSIGKCTKKILDGHPCLTTKYTCDWSIGQYCKPLEPGSVLGKCTSSPSNSLSTCISRQDCKEYEFCKCDSRSGVGYCVIMATFVGTYCREAARIYIDCFRKSNCSQPFSVNPFGCIYQKCFQEAKCLSSLCTENLLPLDVCRRDIICDLAVFNNRELTNLDLSSGSIQFENSSPQNIYISIYLKIIIILIIIIVIIISN